MNHTAAPQPQLQGEPGAPLLGSDGAPLDRIAVTGISAHAFHGVFEHEKREGQTFRADVVIHCDTRAAAASDDLADTVDYGTLGSAIHEALGGEPVDLIEALAERVAGVCLARAGVLAVDVTIHKPQAPLTVPFGNVSLTIRRSQAGPQRGTEPAVLRAVLSLGSNLGSPEAYLQSALTLLAVHPDVTVVGISGLYDSEPWGGHLRPHVKEEPPYVNCVALIETTLGPERLLDLTQALESSHDRTRDVRWGSRTLDIDIVHATQAASGAVTRATERLTLPHPHAAERAFVLVPWLEVEPKAVLAGVPLAHHLARLDPSAVATGVHRRPHPGFVVPTA